ncbi:MAG: hypothetical protein Q9220_003820 [cf. Caloplaca sp. 1 TL-2023]
MAVELHRQRIELQVGHDSITLPKETIKSYLPRLWRRNGHQALASGYLDLTVLVETRGTAAQTALCVILRALKDLEESGVASELKAQLSMIEDRCASERSVRSIFHWIAKLLHPHGPLGCHREMVYAMSEWFSLHAAENTLEPEHIFAYIVALDWLQADMTGPLHSCLRQLSISPNDARRLSAHGLLRRKTVKKLYQLCQDDWKRNGHKRALVHSSSHRLIEGGDLTIEDIIRQYQKDPDSILINLRSNHRRHPHRLQPKRSLPLMMEDFGVGDRCICAPGGMGHHHMHNQLALPHSPLLPFGHPPLLTPPRTPSPLMLMPPVHAQFGHRPVFPRWNTVM